ncbi:UNVERIFIED_ORG: hypothetical protein M2438_002718 [Methylobacterium sp. SuP10 SLI 274]|nr:hypothetical protein [Methylobacterium sp. SuP10 SLI 274]
MSKYDEDPFSYPYASIDDLFFLSKPHAPPHARHRNGEFAAHSRPMTTMVTHRRPGDRTAASIR